VPDGVTRDANGRAASAREEAAGDAPPAGSLTIDELGRETGMTVRTIRSHQARGLLPPPDVRQRTGYYGPEHVARLRLIQELQGEGFNLKGITRLLEETQGPAERLLGLKRAATAPFETEGAEVLTGEELAARFGDDVDPKTLAKAESLGLLVPLGGGRFEAPSPSLLRAAEEVMRRGVSLAAALAVVEQLTRHSEAVARAFVKLFMDGVWKPFEEAGHPDARWSEVVESIERLRPLASDALLAVFQQTMTREVEAAFGNELIRRSRRGRQARG
jgi:DNA-binding transcriptional MerR regulator